MKSIEIPPGYRPQTANSLKGYIAEVPGLARRLGGILEDWQVEEVGDGNLNLVFILRGPSGGMAVKQALPYVRLVGESWPLPLSRAHYEHLALSHHAAAAPGLTPEIYHYDKTLALIAMELLEPHIIMRKGMIAGTVYPRFAEDISTFMARSLFHTSDLALTAERKKAMIAEFAGNTALCKITEELIFTDPYTVAVNNRWTRPWLDSYAESFRSDAELKIAVSRLKLKFLSSAEALIHGDLHTGSVMLTQIDMRVIDPEFAFMGPMGFDVGAIIANLLISYFSQDGHEERPGARDDYREWVLETAIAVWSLFRAKFITIWSNEGWGDAYPTVLFQDAPSAVRLERERAEYMERLWYDSVGFAAAKMIRRILGLAHNIDLEWIKDEKLRATCEARALILAREMMVAPSGFPSVQSLAKRARDLRSQQPPLGG